MEWHGVLRNADGSFTDSFCSRLGFVLCTEGLKHLYGESRWKHALPRRRPWRRPLLQGGDAQSRGHWTQG